MSLITENNCGSDPAIVLPQRSAGVALQLFQLNATATTAAAAPDCEFYIDTKEIKMKNGKITKMTSTARARRDVENAVMSGRTSNSLSRHYSSLRLSAVVQNILVG